MLRNSARASRGTPASPRGLKTRARMRCVVIAAALLSAACYNFNITDPNGQTLQGLSNPNAASISTAMTGLFSASRQDIQGLIWRVASMGREAINLSGNNQPDYTEPYFGPLSSTQFGASVWGNEYSAIRDANIIIDGAPKAVPSMSVGQVKLAIGVAQTLKAQMFMYVIETRGSYGAPVNVDIPPSVPPAPFVMEDSVWATIIYTLDSAITNLQAGITAGASFSFPFPAGYGNFGSTPQAFITFPYALLAKAWCFRATVTSPPNAGYYTNALTALGSSFLQTSGSFTNGVYYDFSSGAGDTPNNLSEPLTGNTYYADTFNLTDAQKQSGGKLDQRVLSKIDSIPAGTTPGGQGGIPMITGNYKFSVYFVNGAASTSAEIPIIRNEELILLQAEAYIGTGQLGAAVGDLNIVREMSGLLPAYSGPVNTTALVNELLYNRRYSLLWEQGARWIDARRFGLLTSVPPAPPPTGIQLGWDTSSVTAPPVSWPADSGYSSPNVPTRMPIPNTECLARGLGSTCNPLGT